MQNRFVEKLARLVDLTKVEVSALEQATAEPRKVEARSDLIREGDRTGPVFVMLDGWAMRYKILPNGLRQVMAFLVPGDVCDLHLGLMAEMDHGIQTITTSRVVTIKREAMDALLDQHRGIARAMYVSQLVDEGTLRAWIVSMGRRSSIERVAHLICELYVRTRRDRMTEGEFEVPLSQVMLADALGMTPVHINRILKELRLAGVMALRRGHVAVLDPIKLARIAGFDENYLRRRLGVAS